VLIYHSNNQLLPQQQYLLPALIHCFVEISINQYIISKCILPSSSPPSLLLSQPQLLQILTLDKYPPPYPPTSANFTNTTPQATTVRVQLSQSSTDTAVQADIPANGQKVSIKANFGNLGANVNANGASVVGSSKSGTCE
jgi:hypothetical protein